MEITEKTGIIAEVIRDDSPRALVIPNATEDDIEGKPLREIEEVARANDGSWFFIDEEEYETGQKVKVFYDDNQVRLESDPLIQAAERIQLVEE